MKMLGLIKKSWIAKNYFAIPDSIEEYPRAT